MFNITFATNSYEIDILVIEVNPVLKTKGSIRASQYVGMKDYPQMVLDELLEDLDKSSHGLVKGKVVKKEYLEEFPTYTKELTLMNKQKSYKLDEQTWLDIMSVDGKAQWNGWLLYLILLFQDLIVILNV